MTLEEQVSLLAGADFVLVSGRNPALLPGLLQRLREGRAGELNVNPTEPDLACGFDPRVLGDALIPDLPRPRLLVWVDSPEQAASVCLRASGHIDGFVWDVPPGPRRNQDLERWRSLGVPFWFHGSPATREHFAEARRAGAEGLSLATPFTFCEESPLDEAIKARVLTLATQSPGQFGPMRRVCLSARYSFTWIISRVGIPSVIATTSLMPDSAASMIASAAKAGGTNTMETSAPVWRTASATVLKTGRSRCEVPPFPGVTPPTTLVPYSIICEAWKVPSLPVKPWTMILLFLFTSTLMEIGLLSSFGGEEMARGNIPC